MKSKSRLTLTGLTASVVLLPPLFCVASTQAQPRYGITDLGMIGSPDDREGAMAINDRSQVVGGYHGHAFLWSDGKLNDLGALPPLGFEDGATSVAYSINNQETIVGCSGSFSAVFGTGLASERAFIAGNDGLRELTKTPGAITPYAINDSGQMAGLDAFRGFFYTNGKLIDLRTLSSVPNGNRSTARSLNQQGQVVGWSTVGTLPVKQFGQLACHAFLWQRQGKSGKMRDLGSLPGWVNSYAYGINRRAKS